MNIDELAIRWIEKYDPDSLAWMDDIENRYSEADVYRARIEAFKAGYAAGQKEE